MSSILVVEDEASTRNNIEQLLILSGYDVFTAENGAKGLELAKQKNPDLIISDIMMKGMDGYELLQRLSCDPVTQCTPLIFLTAMTDISDMRRGMLAGADDYITKPYKARDLLDTIEARLRKKELLEKRIYNLIGNISGDDPQLVKQEDISSKE